MTNENPSESSTCTNTQQEEKATLQVAVEVKSNTQTGPDLDDVKAFCAEFHVNVENSGGILPWLQFSDTNFPEEIMKQFEESEFDMPTPIQSIAWPILTQKRDLVGIASTGTGKTLAFILPLVFHVRSQPPLQPDDGPIAIVLAPTRELVQQIHIVAQPYFNMYGIKSLCIMGGDEREKQINEIGDGKEVYICTPGRLQDFLESKITTLYRVTFIVLDEADKMLDLGFETQVRNILADFKTPKSSSDSSEGNVRGKAQISMFSATWPKAIKALAEDYLTNYVHATVGCLSESHAVNMHIQQIVDFCTNEQQKKQNLLKILNEVRSYAPDKKTIIFVRTRDKVNRLSKELEQNGFKVLLLHGSKSQQIRNEVLKEFRDTPDALLVATDVASRGLDVGDVRFVINFEFPTSDAAYIHRIGRTGRNSRCGTAFTFFSNDDARHAPALIRILDEADAMIHPTILQLGRKNGFNKWVKHVGVPQYPSFHSNEQWPDRHPNDNRSYSQDWSNDYDNYRNNEDLPPNLMDIDFSKFDPSQLRPLPTPLLNANGQVAELDVNTRKKNFDDYKQRCQLLDRLSWDQNENNYSNPHHNYYPYENNYQPNNNQHHRNHSGWSNPSNNDHPNNGRQWNSNQNDWSNRNLDSNPKRQWENKNYQPSNHNNNPMNNNSNNNHNNGQWNGNNHQSNGMKDNYNNQWKPPNQTQSMMGPPQVNPAPPPPPPPPASAPMTQPSQDSGSSDLETNPAILYAKASSEYHYQYNQYTTALQQAMLAQQAGTQITPQQQEYLINFQKQLQVKQQQLQVMQQAASLQQSSILQAAALSAASQNPWTQAAQASAASATSNDLSKSMNNVQQAWMQQWMSAGYDPAQIAAYQQWYAQMQAAASLTASATMPTNLSSNASAYSGMSFPMSNSNQSPATISAPPTGPSSTSNAAQRAYNAYSNRAPTS